MTLSKQSKVIIIRNNRPHAYGGGETYQLTLAEQLRAHDFDPILITSCKRLKCEARQRGYKTRAAWYSPMQIWSGWRNLLLPIYFLWQLVLTIRYCWLFLTIKPNAVNVESRDDLIAATLAGKICRTRILWTDHADFRSWMMQNVTLKYKNIIGKIILRLAKYPHRIILISDADREFFCKLPHCEDLKNVSVIKNGVIDCAHDYNEKSAVDFCYVGRIVEAKGIGEMIAAFESISSQNPKAKLHIYGEGEDSEKYKKLSRNNSQIVFHGFTDQPLKALAQSQIYILPSYSEGLSLSLLEACMMSRAIIATNVGGNPEVIRDGKNGMLVPAQNVEKLAEAMNKMLTEKALRERLSKAARMSYEAEFDFAKTFEKQMLVLYRKDKKAKRAK